MQKLGAAKKGQSKDRKQKLLPFYQFISKINILADLTQSKALLNDAIETDQMFGRKSSDVIESVPLRFTSLEHYVHLWNRLYQEEAKCQIYRSMIQESKQAEPVEVKQLKDIDNAAESKYKLFVLQKLLPKDQKASYAIGTLVILSPSKPIKNTNYTHIIGFVEPGEMLTVKAIFDDSIKNRNLQEWELMISTKRWWIQEICGVNTLEREFYALHNLEEISENLLSLILRPQEHTKQLQKKFKIPAILDQKLKQVFNESQYRSISQCLKQTGITLIQGPPGTGKTKTVLGTLSVLLSSYRKTQQQEIQPLTLNWQKSKQFSLDNDKLKNPWLYTRYTDWRDVPYVENEEDPLNLTSCYVRCDVTDSRILMKKKDDGIELPERVLICGPSNASVDEIIRKLLKQQLIDKDGKSYLPSFVRIGEHYDQTLKEYSLEYLAQKMAEKEHSTDLSLFKTKILNDYRLIFATLSSSGNQIMSSCNVKFDTVIIDEAGQSIEISNLIPLIYGCQRLILIGDPNQLPATIFSQKSLAHRYDQSLFQRLMKSQYPVNILKTQYRMHPEISQVIGDNFYAQKLNNWEGLIAEEPLTTPKAFMIFHMEDAPEFTYKKSFRNLVQAKAIKDFAIYLTKYYEDIGIISPYSQQVSLIQSLIPKHKKCEVKTIDSFQGRQKDVILFSAVRSRFIIRNKKHEQNKKKTIGFVGDLRRINVSLSRAKNLCVIFGDVKKLAINGTWRNIIEKAIAKEQVYEFNYKKNFFQSFKQDPSKFRIGSLE